MAATKTDAAAGQEHLFLSTGEISWKPAAAPPGELKRLFTDPDDSLESRLVRYGAGDETAGEPDLLVPDAVVGAVFPAVAGEDHHHPYVHGVSLRVDC